MESTITSKGQATIPKAIREYLGLDVGDTVKFFVHPNGSVVILPKRPVASLRGLLKHGGRTVTVDEMNAAIADRGARRA